MSVASVQTASAATSGSQTQIQTTFGAGVTSGNTVYMQIWLLNTSRTITTVSDGTNTWTLRVNTTSGTRCELWAAVNVAAGATTLTATVAGGLSASMWAFSRELSGVDTTTPISSSGTDENTSTSVTSHPSTSSLSYNSGDFIAAMGFSNAATGTITPFSGFATDYTVVVSASNQGLAQSLAAGSSGSGTFPWTSGTARQHKCLAAVFAAAGGGGGGGAGPLLDSRGRILSGSNIFDGRVLL